MMGEARERNCGDARLRRGEGEEVEINTLGAQIRPERFPERNRRGRTCPAGELTLYPEGDGEGF